MKSKIAANTSSDYMDINITVAMMTAASFQQLEVCSTFSTSILCILLNSHSVLPSSFRSVFNCCDNFMQLHVLTYDYEWMN